jgi:hypothetical protein
MLDVLVPILTIAAMAWVLRSKISRLRGAQPDVAALASKLGLREVATAPLRTMSSEDRAAIESSPGLRAGLQVLRALPASRYTSYEGRRNGTRIHLSLSTAHRGFTLVTEVAAQPDASWGWGLHMERRHTKDRVRRPRPQATAITTGDVEFDGAVFVQASQPASVQDLLGSGALRRDVAAFLASTDRAMIADDGVRAQLAGPVTDAAIVGQLLDVMTALVQRIDRERTR